MSGIWWNLSFAEPAPPYGRGWLGGVVTEADTLADAITWTHLVGINPGGSVQWVAFRCESIDRSFVDRLHVDRNEWIKWSGPVNPEIIYDPPIGNRPTSK